MTGAITIIDALSYVQHELSVLFAEIGREAGPFALSLSTHTDLARRLSERLRGLARDSDSADLKRLSARFDELILMPLSQAEGFDRTESIVAANPLESEEKAREVLLSAADNLTRLIADLQHIGRQHQGHRTPAATIETLLSGFERWPFGAAVQNLEVAVTVAESMKTFEAATRVCLTSRQAYACIHDAYYFGETPLEDSRRLCEALARASSATQQITTTDKSDPAIVAMYAKSIRSRHQAVKALLDEKRIPAQVRLVPFSSQHYSWILEDTDRLYELTDEEFERLVADRLSAMGLGVRIVGKTHQKDGGVDIVAWPETSSSFPFLLAAQVKHHRTERKTGVGDVREFHSVLTSRGSAFSLGIIVTNTAFTADANWYAANNNVILRLRDLYDLCRWMKGDFVSEDEWREIPDELHLGPGVTIEIPKRSLWLPAPA